MERGQGDTLVFSIDAGCRHAHARCYGQFDAALLIYRRHGTVSMFKKILVAVDGTPTGRRVLDAALLLAKDEDAALHVLHVIDYTSMIPVLDAGGGVAEYVDAMAAGIRQAGKAIIANAQEIASRNGQALQAHLVEATGSTVASAILRSARKIGADLIVMGTHGRRGLRRLVVGSDAEAVLRGATVPVLLLRSTVVGRPPKRVTANIRRSTRAPTAPVRVATA